MLLVYIFLGVHPFYGIPSHLKDFFFSSNVSMKDHTGSVMCLVQY